MAKHIVKCPYCSEEFDTNAVEYIQLNRRYAHKSCYDAAGGAAPVKKKKTSSNEDPELTDLKDYISTLFDSPNWAQITRQLKQYKEELGYSYSGIKKSLVYFYEIKRGDKSKAHGSLGIVPYIYQDAYNYYLSIFMAQQATEDKSFLIKIKEFIIKPPKMRGSKNRLLDWFEEEE